MTTSTPSDNFPDGGFDFVGDVRNDLHGLAEKTRRGARLVRMVS